MANVLNARPWMLDTPSNTPFYLYEVKISQLVYQDYESEAHVVELQDSGGRIVAVIKGKADLSPVKVGPEVGWVSGLLLPLELTQGGDNLQSGLLGVYIV